MAPSLVALTLILTACSGGSGPGVQLLPDSPVNDNGGGLEPYTGPAAQNQDVADYQRFVWENLRGNDRCGQCHGTADQVPVFVRADDINQAYNIALPLINLSSPAESRLVTKVATGHNCWEPSSLEVCTDTIENLITNWAAGVQDDNPVQVIVLTPPEDREVGESKSFPESPDGFDTVFTGTQSVYGLLTTYCADCHREDGPVAQQQPYFASTDVNTAYEAARARIDLDTPANSRFVLRLFPELHNCWNECASDSAEMLAAIQAFSDSIPLTTVDEDLVLSKAVRLLDDGVEASSGGRFQSNAIALYQFNTGSGFTAFDTSGVSPSMNLNLTGNFQWVGGNGIRFTNGRGQASTSSSQKLRNQLLSNNEFSVEAWVVPGNVVQEDSYIVSYSGGIDSRNFTMGQTQYNYDFLNRSDLSDANGNPQVSTPDADQVLQATLQHVVFNYSGLEGRTIYVNGELVSEGDELVPSSLSEWDDSFAFVIGNEVSGTRPWEGVIRFLAIHNQVLTPEQIQQNFDVGVGQRFFLLFNISDVIDVSGSYIVFEVSQFDEFSYLFQSPFYINLDGDVSGLDAPVEGIRLGINGREAILGQAYTNVDTTLTTANYVGTGVTLANHGTIIALEKGPEADEFFLTFERLGDQTNVFVEAVPTAPGEPGDLTPAPDIGLRTFDEVNQTMSMITGVDITNSAIFDTYSQIRQALPVTEAVDGFLAAQQMAVTQLAIEYCNELVDNDGLRTALWPSFNFNASVSASFPASSDQLLDPLIDRVMNTNLGSQPPVAEVKSDLTDLITIMASSGGDSTRTRNIAKGTCAAMLGSAAMLVQ